MLNPEPENLNCPHFVTTTERIAPTLLQIYLKFAPTLLQYIMEITRNAIKKLEEWKLSKNRKPLLIRGARQVGKTTLIRQFSRQFDQYIELNLEKKADRDLFSLTDNIDDLLSVIYLYKQMPVSEKPTLLFIDEIQESPKAIALLRFFYEDKPQLFVVAAGSLLEFALRKVPSFPVGRISYLVLHPLNFSEFLGVFNKEAQKTLHELPVPQFAHPQLKKLFHIYTMIGGMPEIVSNYFQTNNIAALTPLYKELWQTYKDDVEKYSSNESERNVIRHVLEAAPKESDRIKFEGFGNSNYRSREVGEALRILDLARIIRLIYPATNIEAPVSVNYRKRPRLQFLDTGLLTSSLMLQAGMVGLDDLSDFFRGRIIQHVVYQELSSIHSDPGFVPHFWVREEKGSDAEVDLIYQHRQHTIPIEIKAGAKGTLRSLHQFVNMAQHPFTIRLYGGAINTEDAVTPAGKPYKLFSLPYYLASQIPEYLQLLTG